MINNWQEWAVMIILIICLGIIAYKTYLFFRSATKNENPCAGCVSSCELKRQLGTKGEDCNKSIKRKHKKCRE